MRKPATVQRRAAITGIGLVTPLGVGRDSFWQAAVAGRSTVEGLEAFPCGSSVTGVESRLAASVPCGELGGELARRLPEPPLDRRLALADLALLLALEDAGLPNAEREQASVVLGNAVGAPIRVEELYRRMMGPSGLQAGPGERALLEHLSFHTPARCFAGRLGARGRVLTISTGCTAGLDAIGVASDLIRTGAEDVVVTGSAEAPLTPVVFAAFERIGALSRRNEEPERASRPFDRERDGFVLGEGAAVLVLEELGSAVRRGARVYATVSGYASVSNAHHMTNLPADGESLAECIRRVLQVATLSADEIDHVNAHGSSTPQNDLCETNALKSALGARAFEVPVSSLKSMIGHALGASNAIEVAACALSMNACWVLPTINLEEAGEGCDLDYVPQAGRHATLRNVLKLSSGFSGIHSALVLTSPEEMVPI